VGIGVGEEGFIPRALLEIRIHGLSFLRFGCYGCHFAIFT
jgi:hypothetical protein